MARKTDNVKPAAAVPAPATVPAQQLPSQVAPMQSTMQYNLGPNPTAVAPPAGGVAVPVMQHHPDNQLEQKLSEFWDETMKECRESDDFNKHGEKKNQELPLARIKKIMKTDENVKMISAEAPILFTKACEIFIRNLTRRAWAHTHDNKRRTLKREDIAIAISKCDVFDFLIDIVPREEKFGNSAAKKQEEQMRADFAKHQQQQQMMYLAMVRHHHSMLMQQQQGQQAGASDQPTAQMSAADIELHRQQQAMQNAYMIRQQQQQQQQHQHQQQYQS